MLSQLRSAVIYLSMTLVLLANITILPLFN